MSILEGVTMSQLIMITNLLGLPGLVVVFWYVDQRRISKILSSYKEDVNKVSGFYEKNVVLVERYAKLSDDLSDIIHLNTQVQTQLVEQIKNNMFCPMVREKGPHR